MYQTFVDNPRMTRIRERTVWIHVDVPGQGYSVPDLPSEYVIDLSLLSAVATTVLLLASSLSFFFCFFFYQHFITHATLHRV